MKEPWVIRDFIYTFAARQTFLSEYNKKIVNSF